MSKRRNFNKYIDEIHSRQRNIVFPDTVRNGRLVDVFFWRGASNPTRVQRIAAWMFGVVFFYCGVQFFTFAVQARIEDGFSIYVVIEILIALLFALLGVRIFRNGFPRRTKPE